MLSKGLRIGRVFGIDIRIDWSWLFIFLLITWSLSALFGNLHSEWNATLRWGMAIIAGLLFFASVLLHELAHSLIARSQGVNVRNITLFLFGGVSNIQREPPSPGAEFWLTIVGPLTSLVIGFVLIVAVSMSVSIPVGSTVLSTQDNIFGQLGPVPTLLLWLGSINVLVGLFNLIPAFPLDGGRILRSIFWVISKNLRKSTRWAAWIGQGFGFLMIGIGILMIFGITIPILGTGLVNGLWLAFIGWFLSSAAEQSYRRVAVRDVLEDIPVERIIRKDFPMISPEITVEQLVDDFMMRLDVRALPVIEYGKLIGIVTVAIVQKVDRKRWRKTAVKEIMIPTGQFATITAQTDAADAFDKLMQQDFNQLPVIRNGEFEGMLRRKDILRWLQLQSQN